VDDWLTTLRSLIAVGLVYELPIFVLALVRLKVLTSAKLRRNRRIGYVTMAAIAWSGIYWLRFNLELREPFVTDMWLTLAWILPLQAAIFLSLGLYRGLWRFASLSDLQRIVLAAGLGAILIPLVLVMLKLQAVVPRSVLFFYPIVLIFLMAGSRFAYRLWKEHRLYSPLAALGEPVLVVGAGEAGARLTSEMARSRQWRVVGLLDDDVSKHGRLMRNISVLGPIAELGLWTGKYGVRKVIIALPSANHAVRRRVAELYAQVRADPLEPFGDHAGWSAPRTRTG